jgi:hypothetical protein
MRELERFLRCDYSARITTSASAMTINFVGIAKNLAIIHRRAMKKLRIVNF